MALSLLDTNATSVSMGVSEDAVQDARCSSAKAVEVKKSTAWDNMGV
jgi:hypothetical protein